MRFRILISTAIGLVVFGALLVKNVQADEWDKKTTLTFSAPFQVPGTVLPAGTYVFKLMQDDGDRNIVEIYNADGTRAITTVLAIADYRMTTPDRTIVTFDERPAGQPEALKTWFYPGDNFGQEFIYPKQKASELGQVNQQPVLSVRSDVNDPAEMKLIPVVPVAPSYAVVEASQGTPTLGFLSPAGASGLQRSAQGTN